MTKRRLILIILSFVGVLGIAAVVVVVLYFANRSVTQLAVTPVSTEVRVNEDGTKDYGACSIFETKTVKEVLAPVTTTIQDSQSVGLATFENGDEVQVCTYAFIAGGTPENEFNIRNGFSTEVFLHHDATSKDAYLEMQKGDTETVDSIGDTAFYAKRLVNEADVKYVLYVFEGLRHYTFTIARPAGSPALDDETVKQSLLKLVSSVRFN